jgi:hypothetical protein
MQEGHKYYGKHRSGKGNRQAQVAVSHWLVRTDITEAMFEQTLEAYVDGWGILHLFLTGCGGHVHHLHLPWDSRDTGLVLFFLTTLHSKER